MSFLSNSVENSIVHLRINTVANRLKEEQVLQRIILKFSKSTKEYQRNIWIKYCTNLVEDSFRMYLDLPAEAQSKGYFFEYQNKS